MSIILKGIDLPKDEKKPLKIEIWSNGDTYKDYGYGYEYKEGIAIQIPKGHGRLIDGDELKRTYKQVKFKDGMGMSEKIIRFLVESNINTAPTILEAE